MPDPRPAECPCDHGPVEHPGWCRGKPTQHTAWCTDHDTFEDACVSDIYSVREAIGIDQLGPATTVQLGQRRDDTPRIEINLATPSLGLSATLQLAQVLTDLAQMALRTYINEEAAR